MCNTPETSTREIYKIEKTLQQLTRFFCFGDSEIVLKMQKQPYQKSVWPPLVFTDINLLGLVLLDYDLLGLVLLDYFREVYLAETEYVFRGSEKPYY